MLLTGCPGANELVEVDRHVPDRLLEECPLPERNVSTVRNTLVTLAKTEKTAICANGKIAAIKKVLKSDPHP
jgi:hypothetical protein